MEALKRSTERECGVRVDQWQGVHWDGVPWRRGTWGVRKKDGFRFGNVNPRCLWDVGLSGYGSLQKTACKCGQKGGKEEAQHVKAERPGKWEEDQDSVNPRSQRQSTFPEGAGGGQQPTAERC